MIWNENEKNALLIASRDIKCGETLFTSYLGSELFSSFTTKQLRRDYLLTNYGFYCNCKLCLDDVINDAFTFTENGDREHLTKVNKEWNVICEKLLKSTSDTIGNSEELQMAKRFVYLSLKYYDYCGERIILSYEQLCARYLVHGQYANAFKYFKKVLVEKALYNGYMARNDVKLSKNDSEILNWIWLFPKSYQVKINYILECNLNDII